MTFGKRQKRAPYPCRGQVYLIPTADIRPNPAQPRREFPMDKLMELAQSISENGILQPLTVTLGPEGPMLVAGERRLRAARIVGLKEVPCVEVEADGRRRSTLALVENLQRQDMNCFEIARGIRRLMEDHELTQAEAAAQLGYSQSAVANKLRLLRLTPEEQTLLQKAGLSERHARALIRLEEGELRRIALTRAVEGNLTVAQTERMVEDFLRGRIRRRPPKPLIRDVRVFFNTVNRAIDIMRRGGVAAETHRREEDGFIEWTVRIPAARKP